MLTGPRQLTVLPIRHPDLWKLYKQAVACFWTAEEIDLTKDAAGFEKLNPKQQHFLKHVLAFFAASDGLVNANLMERFLQLSKMDGIHQQCRITCDLLSACSITRNDGRAAGHRLKNRKAKAFPKTGIHKRQRASIEIWQIGIRHVPAKFDTFMKTQLLHHGPQNRRFSRMGLTR